MDNILIYSAADNFSIWQLVLPLSRPLRALQGRRPTLHGRFAGLSAFRLPARQTSSRA
jgi:hypothetical protein